MQQVINIPRLVVGAPHGRSGKTTVTMALLSGLVKKKLTVQSFKKGPDFIDPSWHSRVTGRPCRNLDRFLMNEETIKQSLARGARGADIAVVEGAMGLFDGVDLEGNGSTAEIARIIAAPVVLVVNTSRMTRSVAAIVKGCVEFDPRVKVAAVILNKVARPRHEQMLRKAVEYYCGIPVLGAIPKGKQFAIPDRHLGLIPAGENDELAAGIGSAGVEAGKYLDLDGLLELAKKAEPLTVNVQGGDNAGMARWSVDSLPSGSGARVKIGICMDRAFSFYYPENLEALSAAGADLVAVDTLNDADLPELDGLYIGGGFPEIFRRELENNAKLRRQIAMAIDDGMPVYAECGGLMYLGRRIIWQGESHEMVGALPFDVEMLEKPQGHGYIVLKVEKKNPYFPVGSTLKGHEFHHSRVVNMDTSRLQIAWRVTRGYGIDGRGDGLVYKNVLVSYTHLHALGEAGWAPALVKKAMEYRKKRA